MVSFTYFVFYFGGTVWTEDHNVSLKTLMSMLIILKIMFQERVRSIGMKACGDCTSNNLISPVLSIDYLQQKERSRSSKYTYGNDTGNGHGQISAVRCGLFLGIVR